MSEQQGRDDEIVSAGADLPYVDARHVSSEDLRAQVAREDDPHYRKVQEAREQLEATVDELAARVDVRPRMSRFLRRYRPALLAAAALLTLIALRRLRTSGRRRSDAKNVVADEPTLAA